MCRYIRMLFLILLLILSFVVIALPRYRHPKLFTGVLTKEDCEYIKTKAEPLLEPSTIIGEDDYNEIDMGARVSETAWLTLDDPVVNSVVQKCIRHTNKSIQNCENLQVLRYKPGGFYKPHYDAHKEKNMRVHTFILAINGDYEGGETAFPKLDVDYKLKQGDMLFFDNLNNYGFIPSKALHGGKPVKSGEKWICNLWVRKYPYS